MERGLRSSDYFKNQLCPSSQANEANCDFSMGEMEDQFSVRDRGHSFSEISDKGNNHSMEHMSMIDQGVAYTPVRNEILDMSQIGEKMQYGFNCGFGKTPFTKNIINGKKEPFP